MTALAYIRTAILANLNSQETTRRIRARHLAAKLNRRRHCNLYAEKP